MAGVVPLRERRKRAVLVAALLLGLGILAHPQAALANHPAGKKPNVIFIVTDDQRFGTVGSPLDAANGNKPWMDNTRQLFKDGGVTFTQAFTTTPICCPARASILTGQYAHNHKVQTILNEPDDFGANRLQQSSTLQRYLDTNGYHTGIFGKFMNNWDVYPLTVDGDPVENPQYFDQWAIFNSGYYTAGDGLACSNSAGEICVNDQGVSKELPANYYSTHWVRDGALSFLDERLRRKLFANDDSPWFLYVAPYAPHPKAQPEPLYASRTVPPLQESDASPLPYPNYFEGDLDDKPPFVRTRRCCSRPLYNNAVPPQLTRENQKGLDVEAERAAALRALKSVDDMVKEIFDKLAAQGEADETIAFFISDNGYLWGEHAITGKTTPYTNSTKIPMYMRWPGHARELLGADHKRLVGNIDLAPTILDVLDLAPDTAYPIDGRSLLDPVWTRDKLLIEYWNEDEVPAIKSTPTWASLRSRPGLVPPYQYTEYGFDAETRAPDGNDAGYREYYNLAQQPEQMINYLGDGDSSNDPSEALQDSLANDLWTAVQCSGHGPPGGWPPPCP